MKFYRTKENNLINLEKVATIYKDPDTLTYMVAYSGGNTYEMPELTGEDIDRIMAYNDYLIQ